LSCHPILISSGDRYAIIDQSEQSYFISRSEREDRPNQTEKIAVKAKLQIAGAAICYGAVERKVEMYMYRQECE